MSQNFHNYRINDIDRKMQNLGYSILDVLITGATGAGKSSTLNACFQKEVAEAKLSFDPVTKELNSYLMGNNIRIWDTPGFGDTANEDRIHREKIESKLKTRISGMNEYGFIDMIVLVLDASSRDLGVAYKLIKDILIPYMKDSTRIVIGLNQADLAMKGKHWNHQYNYPHTELVNFLDDKKASIKRRIHETTGYMLNVEYYSATTGYNVDKFLDLIINNIPSHRRYLG